MAVLFGVMNQDNVVIRSYIGGKKAIINIPRVRIEGAVFRNAVALWLRPSGERLTAKSF